MPRKIVTEPLSNAAFAPYGDVIAASGTPDRLINQDKCGRFHDLAKLDFGGPEGRAGISVFQGQAYELPLKLEMVERHPLGSQAFLPLSPDPFLVVVADDLNGRPGDPKAFITAPGQGVNYHRNVWHGVLTPLGATRLFAVVDRIGDGENLEEYWFDEPYLISRR